MKKLCLCPLQDKQIHLQLVLSVVHYLVVTSVAKYRSILDAAGGKGEEGVSSLNGPGVATQLAVSQRAPEVGASSESESDSEKSLSCLPDVEQSLMPSTLVVSRAVDVSDQVEASLKLVGHFLCHLLVEHKSVLAKVLVTADGRKLLSDGKSVTWGSILSCTQTQSVWDLGMGLSLLFRFYFCVLLSCFETSRE